MGRELLAVWIAGRPQTRGSKRGFPIKRRDGSTGVAMADSNPKSKGWMNQIAIVAQAEYGTEPPHGGPVELQVVLFFRRPKSHYRANGDVKENAPIHHTKKPDTNKVVRAIEDALSGVVYIDDSQIVRNVAEKRYVDDSAEGALIRVWEVES